MKNRSVKILLILFLSIVAVVGIFATTSYANEENYVAINVKDSNGNSIDYMPAQSGGNNTIFLDINEDYSDAKYEISLEKDFGQSISTELGVFTFEKMESQRYIYTCSVDSNYFTDKKGNYEISFTAVNQETNIEESNVISILFYEIGLSQNANLKVGDFIIIEDGKINNNNDNGRNVYYYSQEEGYQIIYDEINNRLSIFSFNGKVIYSNMGDSFKIEQQDSNLEIICEDPIIYEEPATGIILDSNSVILPPNTVLEAVKIEEHTQIQTIGGILREITNKFAIYDITLKSNNENIQPNGKVKISIPIPSDYDKTKLAVFRIEEDGTKTDLNAIVEGNKAIIETDHFSTYVLAEKNVAENNVDTNINNNELDETPKTGELIKIEIIAILVVSILGLCVLKIIKK